MSRRGVAVVIGLAWLLVMAGSARAANTLEIVEQTGPADNRIDVVIMAEGYTAAEASLFRDHVDNLLAGFFAFEPWASYRGAFNLYRIVTESVESGADHPSQGTSVDTYLDATYDYLGMERLLVVNDARAATVATDLLPEVDFIVVLVNDAQYGGSGGSVATVSIHQLAVGILTHEFGHIFSDLADEYTDPFPGYPPGDGEPNVDFDFAFADLKWNAWVEPSTPLPTLTTDAVSNYLPVGAYEGARFLESGIYRPALWCMMRSVDFDYCAVCTEALVFDIYSWVAPIDDATPLPGTVAVDWSDPSTYPVRFEVLTPDLGGNDGLSVTWLLDDVEVGTANVVELGLAEIAPSPNPVRELRCEVEDRTQLVRSGQLETLTAMRTWNLSVTGVRPDAGVAVDGGAGVDGGGDPVGKPSGCHCRASTVPVALPVWLLLLLLWFANRRRASRTRGTAWRTRRGPW